MKKLMISSLLIVLGMAPWACTRPYSAPVLPKLPAPFTPTITTAATSTPTLTPTLIIPTSTPTGTSTSAVASPTASITPGCGYANVSLPLGFGVPYPSSTLPNALPATPWTDVIRTQADWIAYCGMPTPPAPPVDFNTQMILVFLTENDCFENLSLTSVCEGLTQVTVDLTLTIYSPNICYAIAYGCVGVAVPQSNLPVVWVVN